MTAIVGVLCSDGVIIGADSSATSVAGNFRTIEIPNQIKITIVKNRVVVAGSGSVGLEQRFCNIVDKQVDGHLFSSAKYIDAGCKLSELLIGDMRKTSLTPQQARFSALLAYEHDSHYHLCEFSSTDFQPEWRTSYLWFSAIGSGQPIMDPFLAYMLRVFLPSRQPTLAEGRFVTTFVLRNVIEMNPGGVNGPIQLAVIDSSHKAFMLPAEELVEHEGNVSEFENHCREYLQKFQSATARVPEPTGSS